ncbi:hypothetical protein F5Y05DRAFT_396329 [Hypoxylon sp. FL0543]|nr:hypothetical protein F5Y05DRAFT_396329 [Hypoxylon sp. FL0543]
MSKLTAVSIGTLESTTPTDLEIAECPWKYKGYKDFTSYIAADPDFFAVRRFGRLHTRALLTLQDHLVELEEKLDSLDEKFSLKTTKRIVGSKPPVIISTATYNKCPDPNKGINMEEESPETRDINNGTIRDDMLERAELVSRITAKLAEYDRLLLNHCSLSNMTASPRRNIKNIESWFANNQGAINDEETSFIKHRDDLVSGCKEKSLLRMIFEDQIVLRSKTFLGLFKKEPPPTMSLHDQSKTYQFSDQDIDAFGSVAIFIAALMMLIAPLWILQALVDIHAKLAVITVFIVACLFFLSFAIVGKPFERLAATAGYSAVLVVFLQLGD